MAAAGISRRPRGNWPGEAAAGTLAPAELDEAAFAACLTTAGRGEPDLFIRTGGERRISNFLLWDLAYTELWFTDTLWPDFDEAVYEGAIADFAGRQRRFGRTSAQLERQLMLGQRVHDGDRPGGGARGRTAAAAAGVRGRGPRADDPGRRLGMGDARRARVERRPHRRTLAPVRS